jgi:outer membrane protein, multidrug efflux system
MRTNNRNIIHVFLILVIGVVLGSCSVTKRYKTPPVEQETLYREGQTDDTTSLANLSYKEIFSDTLLQELITEALANNLDLKVAITRIEQSQQYLRQSRMSFFPTLNGNVGVTRSKLSEVQGFGILSEVTQYQANFTSRWELDIWGRLRSNKRASLAALLRSQAGARAVQTNLVGTIANNYYLLLALDRQVAITEQTVLNWDSTVVTMRALKDAGVVTEAAVVQSEAQRYAAEVTIPDLKQQIRETENFLSILLGKAPSEIRRGRLEEQEITSELRTGLPVLLLANRPDVQEAEQSFRNAFELANVARASLYPTLSITGSAGYASQAVNAFFDPTALAASIGAGLAQPIFNGRQLRTTLRVSEAEADIALLQFKNAVLIAGQEVSDALSLHSTATEKAQVRISQIDALEKSVDYTLELLRNGFANYNEVITARQSLLAAELGSVSDRLQSLQATVNLYRSLGGGWR